MSSLPTCGPEVDPRLVGLVCAEGGGGGNVGDEDGGAGDYGVKVEGKDGDMEQVAWVDREVVITVVVFATVVFVLILHAIRLEMGCYSKED